jgi:hypothetical protein
MMEEMTRKSTTTFGKKEGVGGMYDAGGGLPQKIQQ